MAELNKKYLKLRTVRLEEVARYLDCNPEKLRTALKHLAENPSAIQYEIGMAASIGPAASVRALEARASAAEAAIRGGGGGERARAVPHDEARGGRWLN